MKYCPRIIMSDNGTLLFSKLVRLSILALAIVR